MGWQRPHEIRHQDLVEYCVVECFGHVEKAFVERMSSPPEGSAGEESAEPYLSSPAGLFVSQSNS